jgi:hypothetical protein
VSFDFHAGDRGSNPLRDAKTNEGASLSGPPLLCFASSQGLWLVSVRGWRRPCAAVEYPRRKSSARTELKRLRASAGLRVHPREQPGARSTGDGRKEPAPIPGNRGGLPAARDRRLRRGSQRNRPRWPTCLPTTCDASLEARRSTRCAWHEGRSSDSATSRARGKRGKCKVQICDPIVIPAAERRAAPMRHSSSTPAPDPQSVAVAETLCSPSGPPKHGEQSTWGTASRTRNAPSPWRQRRESSNHSRAPCPRGARRWSCPGSADTSGLSRKPPLTRIIHKPRTPRRRLGPNRIRWRLRSPLNVATATLSGLACRRLVLHSPPSWGFARWRSKTRTCDFTSM